MFNRNKDPDFINDVGNKFWLDKTFYDLIKSHKLEDTYVFYVELNTGEKTYLIMQNDQPVYDGNMEQVFVRLNIMGLAQKASK
jgi:hypothetical protein